MPIKRNFLVASDFSSCSRTALLVALQTVHWAAEDTLTLSTVILKPTRPADQYNFNQLDEENRALNDMKQMFLYALKQAQLVDVNVDYQVEVASDIPEAIMKLTQGKTMLIIGSHGAGSKDRLGIGSVSEKLLKICPIPVLLVKDTQ